MIDDTKPAFEFDPLPGETKGNASGGFPVPVDEQTPTGARKKRGRKAKAKKAVRAKRGPRKVQPQPAKTLKIDGKEVHSHGIYEVTGVTTEKPARKKRKQRKMTAGSIITEYDVIGLMMCLPSNSKRKRVLAALNKVFG